MLHKRKEKKVLLYQLIMLKMFIFILMIYFRCMFTKEFQNVYSG